jgi:hypothetical protein
LQAGNEHFARTADGLKMPLQAELHTLQNRHLGKAARFNRHTHRRRQRRSSTYLRHSYQGVVRAVVPRWCVTKQSRQTHYISMCSVTAVADEAIDACDAAAVLLPPWPGSPALLWPGCRAGGTAATGTGTAPAAEPGPPARFRRASTRHRRLYCAIIGQAAMAESSMLAFAPGVPLRAAKCAASSCNNNAQAQM